MSKEGTALLRTMLEEVIPHPKFWTKHTMTEVKPYRGEYNEAYCLVGAALVADGAAYGYPNRLSVIGYRGSPGYREALARLCAATETDPLLRTPVGMAAGLERWNDKARTNYQAVRAAIEKAIGLRKW